MYRIDRASSSPFFYSLLFIRNYLYEGEAFWLRPLFTRGYINNYTRRSLLYIHMYMYRINRVRFLSIYIINRRNQF